MTDSASPRSQLPAFCAIASLALALLAIWLAVHAGIIGRDSEDDLHYLYYSATKGVDSQKYQATGERVGEFLQNEAKDPHYAYRFNERQKLVDNYPLLSLVIREVRAQVLPGVLSGTLSYPAGLVRIFNISLHTTITLTLLCFAACLPLVRRAWLLWISFGLVLILAMDWYFPWQPAIWILHVRPQNLAEVFERMVQTMGLAFTAGGIASDFPRGNFLLLVLPVFLLRWSLCYRSSYALAAAASLVHFSMGLLLILCLVFTDILIRRTVLRSPVTLAVVTGVFGLSATIMTIQLEFLTAWFPLAVSAIVASLLWKLSEIRRPAVVDALTDKLARHGPILSDLFTLYGIWLVVLPISVIMYFQGGPPKPLWTWGELPGRYLMMMRGPLLLGIILLVVEKFPRTAKSWANVFAFVSVAGGLGLLVHSFNLPNVRAMTPPALPEQFSARERVSLSAGAGQKHEYVEADVYFSAARSLDLGISFPNALLTYTPGACRRRDAFCKQ